MTSFKDPSYQDRIGRAAEAKQKALDQLKARPAADPAALAERQAARAARETAQAAKRAADKAAKAEAKTQAAEAKAQAAQAEAAPGGPTEEERKQARDARYAARKGRK
jgi:FKBP-type peptidyl-prolyl cis-trans isomerase